MNEGILSVVLGVVEHLEQAAHHVVRFIELHRVFTKCALSCDPRGFRVLDHGAICVPKHDIVNARCADQRVNFYEMNTSYGSVWVLDG